jgi:hypothetical protein
LPRDLDRQNGHPCPDFSQKPLRMERNICRPPGESRDSFLHSLDDARFLPRAFQANGFAVVRFGTPASTVRPASE